MTKSKQPRKEKTFATYDEDARREFLTGFKKRKDERRAKALIQESEMAKEARRQARAESRREAQEQLEYANGLTSEVMPDDYGYAEAVGGGGGGGGGARDEAEFADDFSRAAFGASTVLVTTAEGWGDEEAEMSLEKARDDELRELAAPALAAAAAARDADATLRNKRLAEALAARAKSASKNSKKRRGGGGNREGGGGDRDSAGGAGAAERGPKSGGGGRGGRGGKRGGGGGRGGSSSRRGKGRGGKGGAGGRANPF
jgi:hypothetical protein